MEAIAEILEQELEEAFEVKNKKSLHRYIVLLTENIVRRESYKKEQFAVIHPGGAVGERLKKKNNK